MILVGESMGTAGPYATTLCLIQKAGHEDLYRFDQESYRAKIGDFLGQTLGPPAREREE